MKILDIVFIILGVVIILYLLVTLVTSTMGFIAGCDEKKEMGKWNFVKLISQYVVLLGLCCFYLWLNGNRLLSSIHNLFG